MTLREAIEYLEQRRNSELAEETTDWSLVEAIEVVCDRRWLPARVLDEHRVDL